MIMSNRALQDLRCAVQRPWDGLSVSIIVPVLLIVCARVLAQAGSSCPVTLVGGEGDANGIVISLLNAGKEPIRRVEFDSVAIRGHTGSSHANRAGVCSEENTMLFPATPYDLKYAYPGGVAVPVLVSVKLVALSDGYIWKPSKHQKCRTLRIVPKRQR